MSTTAVTFIMGAMFGSRVLLFAVSDPETTHTWVSIGTAAAVGAALTGVVIGWSINLSAWIGG